MMFRRITVFKTSGGIVMQVREGQVMDADRQTAVRDSELALVTEIKMPSDLAVSLIGPALQTYLVGAVV